MCRDTASYLGAAPLKHIKSGKSLPLRALGMNIWGQVLGGFPRSREQRHNMRDVERGDASLHESTTTLLLSASAVIGVQEAANLRLVTDGMLDWHDIFRPFVSAWRGVTTDGLLRYFDNNFFYRVPVFLDRPDPAYFVWPPRLKTLSRVAEPWPMKVVVPGPLSFLLMSKNASGLSKEELGAAIASALQMEVKAAERAGAAAVQIDEPILSDQELSRDEARFGVELVNSIVSQLSVPTTLAVYFNAPRDDIYDEILEAKTTYISIDVADSPARSLDLLKRKGMPGHKPILGVIDARRLEDDDYARVKEWVAAVAKLGFEEISLTTTTWFDVIPYRFSLRKTFLLGLYVERLANELR